MLGAICWYMKVAHNRMKWRSLSTWMITMRCETLEHAIVSSSFSGAWPGWGDSKVRQQSQCMKALWFMPFRYQPSSADCQTKYWRLDAISVPPPIHPCMADWYFWNFQWFLVMMLYLMTPLVVYCSACATIPTVHQIPSSFAVEKQPGLKPHGVVNSISHTELCRNSLY